MNSWQGTVTEVVWRTSVLKSRCCSILMLDDVLPAHIKVKETLNKYVSLGLVEFISFYKYDKILEYVIEPIVENKRGKADLVIVSKRFYNQEICDKLFELGYEFVGRYSKKMVLSARRARDYAKHYGLSWEIERGVILTEEDAYSGSHEFIDIDFLNLVLSFAEYKDLVVERLGEELGEGLVEGGLVEGGLVEGGLVEEEKMLVGRSECIVKIYKNIKDVSKMDSPVIIYGESGTGKELVAQAIHKSSKYGQGPFVAINCAAIPKDLLESELFGYTKGAFTGALKSKKGYFIEADGGTLFLDEIGDLDLSLQVKLLRVLETKEVRPLGCDKTYKVDIRLISATHQDLRTYVLQNLFRDDLYFRISVFSIEIPPLRERLEDIPLLAKHFLKELNIKYENGKIFTNNVMSRLSEYSWKGNVRELRNVVERLFSYSEGLVIDYVPEEVFQFNLKPKEADKGEDRGDEGGDRVELDSRLMEHLFYGDGEGKNIEPNTLAEIECKYISLALNKTKSISESARKLGISRDTLYRKMKRYKIPQSLYRNGHNLIDRR